ncbi:MAG: hypothetical protein ACRD7E_17925 [Bryobacteraceae bacterium]
MRRRSPRRGFQLLTVVLKDVQRVRGEVVLVPRVEHDRFLGIQPDVGPNEKQVVRLPVWLVVESLDPENPVGKSGLWDCSETG